MTDIVPNLLRLSSEATDVSQLLESSLDFILPATNSDSAAVARATVPEWSVEAVRGVAKSAIPFDLAAEALERGEAVAKDRWVAAPLKVTSSRRSGAAEAEYV